jgi:hypothetical protein
MPFLRPISDRYFEDYVEGDVHRFGTIAVEADEIVAFAKRFDPQTLHTDPEAAKSGPFGGLIARGWHTAGLMTRLFVDHYLTKVASLGNRLRSGPNSNRLRSEPNSSRQRSEPNSNLSAVNCRACTVKRTDPVPRRMHRAQRHTVPRLLRDRGRAETRTPEASGSTTSYLAQGNSLRHISYVAVFAAQQVSIKARLCALVGHQLKGTQIVRENGHGE